MNAIRLGAYIRTLRTQKKMTQQSLAERIHVTDKAVSKWERGLSLPDISLFPSLAQTLNVSISDLLLEGTDEGTPSHLVQIYENDADIRTPLHIMLGCANLLKKYRNQDELFNRYLKSIIISGEYLLSVLERAQHTGELEKMLCETPSANDKSVTEYDFSGKRFLVVEDIEVNREIAAEILKDTGAAVEVAEDGNICIEKVSSMPPNYYDLILMDIHMPNMDGLEATRKLRKLGCQLPIIAMTANVSEQDRTAALKAGMNAFTEKPVFTEKLFSTLQEALNEPR